MHTAEGVDGQHNDVVTSTDADGGGSLVAHKLKGAFVVFDGRKRLGRLEGLLVELVDVDLIVEVGLRRKLDIRIHNN